MTIFPVPVLTLDENSSISESRFGLTDRPLKVLLETSLIPDDSHSPSSSSHRGLDDDGESVFLDESLGEVVGLYRTGRSGHNGDTGLLSQGTGFGLVT
jgi:hypothetical protein